MNELVRELVARVGLDVDGAAFELADGMLGIVKKGLFGLGVFAATAGLALAGMVGKTAKAAGELNDLAGRTGLDVELLQRLGHAAMLNGVSMGELAQGLNQAAKKGGKDLPKLLMETADEVQRLNAQGRHSEAVALMMDRFGRSGARLLPMLRGGGAALKEMMDEADALGLVMSKELIAQGDELSDNFDRIRAMARGAAASIAADFIPDLLQLTNAAIKWWRANRREVVSTVVSGFRALGKVLGVLWTVLKPMLGLLARLVQAWKAIAVVVASVATVALIAHIGAIATTISWYGALSIAAIRAALSSAAAWGAAALPIILIGAAIAAMILIVQDLWTTLEGGNGIMAGLYGRWYAFWAELVGADPETIAFLRGLDKALAGMGGLKGAWQTFVDYVKYTAGELAKVLEALFTGQWTKFMVGIARFTTPGGEKMWDTYSALEAAKNGDLSPLRQAVSSGQLFDAGGASSPAIAAAMQTSAQPRSGVSGDLNVGGMTIVQQPGENAQDFATRIRSELEDLWGLKSREADAAMGTTP